MVRDVSTFGLPAKHVGDRYFQGNPRFHENDFANSPEKTEAEISRLTWLVIDGEATAEQRKRLADLVSEQHAHRQF